MREPQGKCLFCEREIVQPRMGRRRKFCGDSCKVAYHREKVLREQIERDRGVLIASLPRLHLWEQLDPRTTQLTLARIALDYGVGAVLLAISAIEQEMRARKIPALRKKYRRPSSNRPEREHTAQEPENEVEGEVSLGEAEPLD